MHISAVVLAGGEARRFGGESKANLVIGGETIISRILLTLKDIFEEIIIVSNKPLDFKDDHKCLIVPDIFRGAGPAGGIHAGMKACSNDSVFVFACDMPFLDKRLIVRQIRIYRTGDYDAVVPRLRNLPEPLHSVYSASVLPVLERMLTENGDKSMKSFLNKLNVKYFTIKYGTKAALSLTNINTPSDLNIGSPAFNR